MLTAFLVRSRPAISERSSTGSTIERTYWTSQMTASNAMADTGASKVIGEQQAGVVKALQKEPRRRHHRVNPIDNHLDALVLLAQNTLLNGIDPSPVVGARVLATSRRR